MPELLYRARADGSRRKTDLSYRHPDLLYSIDMPLPKSLRCGPPRRLHETEQTAGIEKPGTVFDGSAEIFRMGVVAAGGYLIESTLFQFVIGLNLHIFRIELQTVVPVALEN